MNLEPYLTAAELKHRRIVFAHCENDSCGFFVEFKYPNNTFYYCENFKVGANLPNAAADDIVCPHHGKMRRYVLLKEDNMCPVCADSTLAILSASI